MDVKAGKPVSIRSLISHFQMSNPRPVLCYQNGKFQLILAIKLAERIGPFHTDDSYTVTTLKGKRIADYWYMGSELTYVFGEKQGNVGV